MLGMMGPDKNKNVASLILEGMDGDKKEVNGPEQDASAGLEASMHKFISCVHAKDAKGCAAALGDFIEMHEKDEGDDEGDEQAEPEAPVAS